MRGIITAFVLWAAIIAWALVVWLVRVHGRRVQEARVEAHRVVEFAEFERQYYRRMREMYAHPPSWDRPRLYPGEVRVWDGTNWQVMPWRYLPGYRWNQERGIWEKHRSARRPPEWSRGIWEKRRKGRRMR